jgi:hypothetical protein
MQTRLDDRFVVTEIGEQRGDGENVTLYHVFDSWTGNACHQRSWDGINTWTKAQEEKHKERGQ